MFVDRSRTLRVKTQPLLAGDTVHWVTQETPEALAPRPCHARRPQSPRASCEQEETVVLIELRGLQPESGVRGQERSHLDGRSLLKEKQDSPSVCPFSTANLVLSINENQGTQGGRACKFL